MKKVIIKSEPYSQFRLGVDSLDKVSNIIHSDTLFSAITNLYSIVFDDVENFIEAVNNNKIRFSSAFPVLMDTQNSNHILFVPKPILNYPDENTKELKKIEFVSLKLAEDILNAANTETLKAEKPITSNENIVIIGSSFASLKDELKSIDSTVLNQNPLTSETIPKNRVHTNIQEDTLYHETNVQLMPLFNKAGKIVYQTQYYFFLETDIHDELYDKLKTILNLLPEEGIGGQRSQGKGLFYDTVIDNFNIEKNPSVIKLLLSLVNPQNQREFDNFIYYEILTRGGGSVRVDDFVNSDTETEVIKEVKKFRKQQVRMIKEGAVFKDSVQGQLVDISPENNNYGHSFFRNGKCFSI